MSPVQRKLSISFPELPARPREASALDVSRLFGGCNSRLRPCTWTWDCCSGLVCLTFGDRRMCINA
jgi:hypothetical protein